MLSLKNGETIWPEHIIINYLNGLILIFLLNKIPLKILCGEIVSRCFWFNFYCNK